jgi:acetyltransferase-like isoleucine patch superfamily enzyme
MAYRRWRFGLKHVHPTFYMASSARVSRDLEAHEYSFINMDCVIGPKVELGRYVMLAPRVSIVGGDHIYTKAGVPIIFSGRPELPRTIIEADAWIGYGAIIVAGVRIGHGAIVGAGAVVTKDVPASEIHAGVPAKKIGERFFNEGDRRKHDRMLSGSATTGTFCPPME